MVGSPFYIAPEVLAGGYNEAADVWSAGVILYILLSGIPPFWGKTKSKIFECIRSTELRFPSDPWDKVSDSAKELITEMLRRDPRQRLTAKQVLGETRPQSFQKPHTFNFLSLFYITSIILRTWNCLFFFKMENAH
jgi:serine/threonine protein kinase